MSEPADIAACTERFNDAVRAFTPPVPSRHAKLMPFKDGIVELRQKGGSYRLIRELLATINVAVGTDTIARFLAEVNGEPSPQRTTKRPSRGRVSAPIANQVRPAAAPPSVPQPTALPLTPQPRPAAPVPTPMITTPAERPRTRGPRIADPSNL